MSINEPWQPVAISHSDRRAPQIAPGRPGRIWPPAAGTFARIIDGHPSPAATSPPSRQWVPGYIDRRHAE